jgi:hypothetical protein
MAVQNSPFHDTNIVGRVLADAEGRGRVEKVLQEQREAVMGLLSRNMHLVTALRDALIERDELIGHEITDVLESAQAAEAGQVIDLRDVPSISAAPAVAASNRLGLPGPE